ncbi:MAG TPA: CDP-alcohol phosphatidyltransferase family protein [Stellaceae bacterium]|nr:CDP-alcohol phosphatidyltransferase family protein [Stellaceae bacterium]
MLDLPDTKPLLERLFRPPALGLSLLGIRPNALTLASLAVSTLVGTLAFAVPTATWPLLMILAAMLTRLALNHMDGIIARERGMKTPLGGLLNEMATPVEDMALYLPLAARSEMPAALIVCVVMSCALVEVAGLASLAIGGARRFDGPMSKVVRGVFFGMLVIAVVLRLAPASWAPSALVLALILLAVTAGNRLRRAVEEIRP